MNTSGDPTPKFGPMLKCEQEKVICVSSFCLFTVFIICTENIEKFFSFLIVVKAASRFHKMFFYPAFLTQQEGTTNLEMIEGPIGCCCEWLNFD